MTEFISLADIPGEHENEDAMFTWDFSLPPSLDAERIELNASKIRQIQKIAHFSASHVIGYQGETTQVVPGVSGISSDGTATATRSFSISKARTYKSNLNDEYDDDTFMMSNGTTETYHHLNKSEIVSRVVDLKSANGWSSEQAWSHELDSALNKSIRAAAKEHLMRGSRYQRGISYFMYAQGVGYTAIEQDPRHIGTILGIKALLNGTELMINKYKYGETMYHKRRWSFDMYDTSQPDRYFAVNALSRIGSTIRVAK